MLQKVKENYKKPTPWKWRKIGDVMLLVGTTVTSITAFTMPPYVTAIAVIVTALGKILSNLPVE